MKKRLLLLLLLCIRVVCNASVPVMLVKDHHTNWQIVNVSAKVEAKFAAGELQKYISQISGAQLPFTKAKGNCNIIIGLRRDIPAEYRSLLPAPKKGYDGYTVTISNKPAAIIIAGDNGPGVIYGVYDLLEKMGCRWFYPTEDPNDPEVVPRKNTMTVNSARWAVASPLQYRICNGDEWFFDMKYPVSIKQADWAMKNRYNGMGWQAMASNQNKSLITQYKELDSAGVTAELKKRGMFIHGPAHSFDQLLSNDKYFATPGMVWHAEW